MAAALNFATTPAYTLVIQATDGTNSATANYNIQVISANQNDPVWSQANEIVSVDENVSTGTAVPYTVSLLQSCDLPLMSNRKLEYSSLLCLLTDRAGLPKQRCLSIVIRKIRL